MVVMALLADELRCRTQEYRFASWVPNRGVGCLAKKRCFLQKDMIVQRNRQQWAAGKLGGTLSKSMRVSRCCRPLGKRPLTCRRG